MTASPSPLRPSALALVATSAVGGAISTAAVAAAPEAVRLPLGWFAGAGTLLLALAACALTWSWHTRRELRRRAARLTEELASREARLGLLGAEAARFHAAHAAERAETAAARSAELDRLTAAHHAERARAEAEHAEALDRLVLAQTAELDALVTAQATTRERLGADLRRAESGRAAAMAAAANAAGRMQALATGMLADLRDMEHRHADEEVLGDLLHLDHRTAQAGRLADSIAVLTGARSGRRWARPIVMESILRGAMGRIGGYQRVRLHSTCTAAVAGHAAEGVMHALAELMDNAANFSPPTAEVHVYVEEVPVGVVITIEDSGLVMSDVQLRRAEAAVGGENTDLAGLSGTRLGLAVVGRLARKHNLAVSFRPSARGGTGALLRLPAELITEAPAPAPAPERPADPRPAARPALPAPRRESPEAPAARPALTRVPAPRVPDTGSARPRAEAAPETAGEADRTHTGREEQGLPDLPTRTSTRRRPPAEDPAPPAPAPVADAPEPAGPDTAGDPDVEYGESGLPRRRRGRALAAAHPDGPDAGPRSDRTPAPSPSRSVARFGSFRQAVRGASARPTPGSESEPEPGPEHSPAPSPQTPTHPEGDPR
ncbi:ATP-binding protein [Streptomyces sp. BI20]|uniref:ATP-binding protein n=1 Tax=Streptomyces sp. BI20 TaxID=3403460 RepID=UPI003C737CB7